MKNVSLLLLVTALVTGCAPATRRGVVALPMGDEKAQVCLGRGEAAVGDKVALYRNKCESWPSDVPNSRLCEKRRIGAGEITEIVNEHFSVARLSASIPVKEGDVVELE